MQASLRVRDLLIASWPAELEKIREALPAGLEPAEIEGRSLLSMVAFHVYRGRLGPLPILPYAQLNVRTYVTWKDEPAVFFLAARVTPGGLPGRLLRAPFRAARLRVGAGNVRAPGLGVSLRYRLGPAAEPGPLGRHELGLYEHGGLRQFRIERSKAEWQRAELIEPPRADLLLALGFELGDEPDLLYARHAAFETEVPPRRPE